MDYDLDEELSLFASIQQLQLARDNLTPIISKMLTTSCSSRQERDKPSKYNLSWDQYEHAIWASQILNEIDYECKRYRLPNTDFIINYAIEEKHKEGKVIMIDEATMIELVDLYHKMGIVLQKLTQEAAKSSKRNVVNDKNEIVKDEIDILRSGTTITKDEFFPTDKSSENLLNETKNVVHFDKTNHGADVNLDQKYNSSKSSIQQIEDPVAAKKITPNFTGEISQNEPNSCDDAGCNLCGDETRIFIKIQCLNNLSESDYEKSIANTIPLDGISLCNSCCQIRLGGEPGSLKVSKSQEEGIVYYINTKESQENEVKIVIKQCPECRSTVIASSTKMNGTVKDSHESMILHGKDGDEDQMILSFKDSDQSRLCQCKVKTLICQEPCDETTSPCVCPKEIIKEFVEDTKLSQESTISLVKTATERKSISSQFTASLSDIQVFPDSIDLLPGPRSISQQVFKKSDDLNEIILQKSERLGLDVLLDPDNVDKSTVRVRTESKAKSPLLLTRRRICSSMEFDVSKVLTRLREHEIEHKNSTMVLELEELGVDQILRACRPAKCCRKAILNEEQKVALPYCVSLRSLPLLGNDIEVIKQSIDMSIRKIKNSLDLTQNNKDKLAFYVSLGQDDFKPNINFPWVVPIYDLQIGKQKAKQKVFVLKKKQSEGLSFANQIIGDGRRDKFYYLSKTASCKKLQNISMKTKVKVKINKECIFAKSKKFQEEKCCWNNSYIKKDSVSGLTFDQSFENRKIKRKYFKTFMDAGDSPTFHHRFLGLYFDKLQKSLTSSASWTQLFQDMRYKSNAMTVLVKREHSFGRPNAVKIFTKEELENFKKSLLSEIKLEDFSRRKLESLQILLDKDLAQKSLHLLKKKTYRKNKLEYYVGLIDGNLVWSESLPLKPMNYQTFHGFVNSSRSSIQENIKKKNNLTPSKTLKKEKLSKSKSQSVDQEKSKLAKNKVKAVFTKKSVFATPRHQKMFQNLCFSKWHRCTQCLI